MILKALFIDDYVIMFGTYYLYFVDKLKYYYVTNLNRPVWNDFLNKLKGGDLKGKYRHDQSKLLTGHGIDVLV